MKANLPHAEKRDRVALQRHNDVLQVFVLQHAPQRSMTLRSKGKLLLKRHALFEISD